jgi:hypothetical protein
VLFCVLYSTVLYCIVVPLPPGTYPLAVIITIIIIIIITIIIKAQNYSADCN